MNKKVILLVLDGFGIGALPDAKKYGEDDAISNTFLNIEKLKPFKIPNLTKLGLKNIDGIQLNKKNKVIGSYARLKEKSIGKDTTTGHFEMMRIITKKPSPTYPNGFDKEIVKELEKIFNSEILGNCIESGTEIIKKLGDEHLKTGKPIVYTSADSVLQVACHIDKYTLKQQYEFCEKIRKLMTGKNAVGRVISRPFTTIDGKFKRLDKERKDFSLIPPKPNTLSRLQNKGFETVAVGKINDIFAGYNISTNYYNHTNDESIKVAEKLSKQSINGLIFVNLVDTDMVYGHRNDIDGYRKAIENVDKHLSLIMKNLSQDDVLIITGDHGCDPTTQSTDHSREYVPLLIYSKNMKKTVNLGTLNGIDTVGKIIEHYLIKDENLNTILENI